MCAAEVAEVAEGGGGGGGVVGSLVLLRDMRTHFELQLDLYSKGVAAAPDTSKHVCVRCYSMNGLNAPQALRV